MTARTPAQPAVLMSIETEQALLGALMVNNDIMALVEAHCGADDFADAVHARLFATIRKRISAGLVASPVTLKSVMALDEGLRELGGTDYLARLAGAAVGTLSAPDLAQQVRDLALRRQIRDALVEAEATISDPAAETGDAIEKLQERLAAIGAGAWRKALVHDAREALAKAAHRTEAAFRNAGRPMCSSGFGHLDSQTGGLMPGEHWVLLGESSMGKTGLAIQIALNVARQGFGVLVCSLEMQSEQIAMRMQSEASAATAFPVPYKRIRTGDLTADEFRNVLEVSLALERLPLLFAEDQAVTLGRMRSAIALARRQLKAKGCELALVIVDYLQQIQVADTRSDYERVSAAARAMKEIAKSESCTVISLSQMRKLDTRSGQRRPQKSDARNSGEIEESADFMIGIYREAYHLARSIQGMEPGPEKSEAILALARLQHHVEAIFLKARAGDIQTVWLWADVGMNRFLDVAPDAAGQPEQEFMEF